MTQQPASKPVYVVTRVVESDSGSFPYGKQYVFDNREAAVKKARSIKGAVDILFRDENGRERWISW